MRGTSLSLVSEWAEPTGEAAAARGASERQLPPQMSGWRAAHLLLALSKLHSQPLKVFSDVHTVCVTSRSHHPRRCTSTLIANPKGISSHPARDSELRADMFSRPEFLTWTRLTCHRPSLCGWGSSQLTYPAGWLALLQGWGPWVKRKTKFT